ncbi:hypothetical protein HQQ80_07650 [Microbacteriaceae bacterium VKM Ac-2855]|nr:hypothetical protein [Microbacteriaceae bacterium VKM Ac-2855]
MDTAEALDRAKTRFADGDVNGAVSLLERCVQADPGWVDPRILLSEVYRRSGDLIEAGRWGYLVEDGAAPEELSAFERALVRSGEDPFLLAERALVSPLILAEESDHAARMLAALPQKLIEAAHYELGEPDPLDGEWFEHEAIASPVPRRGGIVGFIRSMVAGVFVIGGVVLGAAVIVAGSFLLVAALIGSG